MKDLLLNILISLLCGVVAIPCSIFVLRISECYKKYKSTRGYKRMDNDNIRISKRIAAVISILLCITLYLSFLSAFTTKRDTYICYTTKTGECFHSAICQYASKTAYETTVYEACRKYKPCSQCNPCVEQYKTTITDRNYIIPIFISVPTSAAIFFLLTYKKKELKEEVT